LHLDNLTSLLIDPQIIRGPLQPAAVLIQAKRHAEAHRLLLNLSRKSMDDPNLWLLLAWTAPSPTAALEYYRACIKLNPQNDLARAGIRSSLATLRQGGKTQRELPPLTKSFSEEMMNSNFSPESHSASTSGETTFLTKQSSIINNKAIISTDFISMFTQGLLHLSDVHFTWILVVYIVLLAVAELLTTYSAPQLGLGLHGILMVILFLHASFCHAKAQRRFLFTLALPHLIRLLSLSMPLSGLPFLYWYAIIGLPLLLSAYLVFRFTEYKPADVGLSFRKFPIQLYIGILGLPLGWLEYRILKPEPLAVSLRLQDILVPALILLVFTGFLEEFIFRGLMQTSSQNVLGKYGINLGLYLCYFCRSDLCYHCKTYSFDMGSYSCSWPYQHFIIHPGSIALEIIS
jgi:membrane protease YdiL (CAAX protease family)